MASVAQPIGKGFPTPRAVTAPDGEIPTPPADAAVRITLDGVDITMLVFTASWRHGEQQPNRVGQVARPADGNLFLNRVEYWSPLNPHPMLNTAPGAVVEIKSSNGDILFAGFSRGVVVSSAPTTGGRPDVALMPLYGRLHRVSEYNDGVFLKLPGGTPLVTDVFRQVSDKAEDAGEVEVIGPSRLRVYGPNLNSAGALSSGRNLVNILNAYNLLAVVESGRIYDNPEGRIIFETYQHRLDGDNARRVWSIAPQHAQLLDPERLIVNIMSSDSTELASLGTRPLRTIPALPQTITVAPGVRRGIRLGLSPAAGSTFPEPAVDAIDDLKDYASGLNTVIGDLMDAVTPKSTVLEIESVDDISSPNDYTWTGPGVPDVEADANEVTVYFDNRTGTTQATATLKEIRGNVTKPSGVRRLYARNSDSVDLYGPKTARYPADVVQGFQEGDAGLLRQQETVQALLERWVAVYSGVDGDGKRRPAHAIKVRYQPPKPYEVIYPSDMVLLTWVSPWVEHCRDYPMWVDAVDWDIDSEGTATVELLLRSTIADTLNPVFVRNPDLKEVGFIKFEPPLLAVGTVPLLRRLGEVRFLREVGRVPLERPVGMVPFVRTPPPPWTQEAFDAVRNAPQGRLRWKHVNLNPPDHATNPGVSWTQTEKVTPLDNVQGAPAVFGSGRYRVPSSLGRGVTALTFWMPTADAGVAKMYYQPARTPNLGWGYTGRIRLIDGRIVLQTIAVTQPYPYTIHGVYFTSASSAPSSDDVASRHVVAADSALYGWNYTNWRPPLAYTIRPSSTRIDLTAGKAIRVNGEPYVQVIGQTATAAGEVRPSYNTRNFTFVGIKTTAADLEANFSLTKNVAVGQTPYLWFRVNGPALARFGQGARWQEIDRSVAITRVGTQTATVQGVEVAVYRATLPSNPRAGNRSTVVLEVVGLKKPGSTDVITERAIVDLSAIQALHADQVTPIRNNNLDRARRPWSVVGSTINRHRNFLQTEPLLPTSTRNPAALFGSAAYISTAYVGNIPLGQGVNYWLQYDGDDLAVGEVRAYDGSTDSSGDPILGNRLGWTAMTTNAWRLSQVDVGGSWKRVSLGASGARHANYKAGTLRLYRQYSVPTGITTPPAIPASQAAKADGFDYPIVTISAADVADPTR